MKVNKENILSVLKALDKEKYSILEIGLFGSYAREEETDSSDIDIIVKIEFKKDMYRNFLCFTRGVREYIWKESRFSWKECIWL